MRKGYVAVHTDRQAEGQTDRQKDKQTYRHTHTHISEVTLQFPVTLFGEDSTTLLQGGEDFEGVISPLDLVGLVHLGTS